MNKIVKTWWDAGSNGRREQRRIHAFDGKSLRTRVLQDEQGRRWLMDLDTSNRVLIPAGHSLKFKKLNKFRLMIMAMNALEK